MKTLDVGSQVAGRTAFVAAPQASTTLASAPSESPTVGRELRFPEEMRLRVATAAAMTPTYGEARAATTVRTPLPVSSPLFFETRAAASSSQCETRNAEGCTARGRAAIDEALPPGAARERLGQLVDALAVMETNRAAPALTTLLFDADQRSTEGLDAAKALAAARGVPHVHIDLAAATRETKSPVAVLFGLGSGLRPAGYAVTHCEGALQQIPSTPAVVTFDLRAGIDAAVESAVLRLLATAHETGAMPVPEIAADSLRERIRARRGQEGRLDIAPGTTFVVLGDASTPKYQTVRSGPSFNFTGSARQVGTLGR